LTVLLAVRRLPQSITTLMAVAAKSISADCLHQRRVGPGAIGLGGLRKRRPCLRIELRIVLLGIEVSHRLFSLRWLVPLSPRRTKTTCSRLRTRTGLTTEHFATRASRRPSGMPHSCARSLNRIESIGTGIVCKEQFRPISVNVSATYWASRALRGQIEL
jgi:hypothetical protein